MQDELLSSHAGDEVNLLAGLQLDPLVSQPPENRPEHGMGFVLRRSRAGIFVRDLVNRTVKWSPELYELLGIDPSTLSQSETFMNMVHPDDYARVTADTQAAIEQGGTYYQEFRVIRPDGTMLWLSSVGFVEHDTHGRPLTLTGINQDITRRKEAEQAQQKAHAEAINEKNRLLAMMDALPVGVAILNIEGQILQSNHYFDEVWGTPRPEVTSVAEFVYFKAWWVESNEPVRAEEWAAAVAIRDGITTTNQFFEIERFDGSHRFVLNSAAPILDHDGKRAGCAVAIRDITERVFSERALLKSERALRESEERLRVTLTSLPITTYMLDRDLRYTWVYNTRLGMTAEKMLGRRDDEIYPGISEEHMAQLRSVIDTGHGFQREIATDIFGDQKFFWLSVEPFIDTDGKPAGLIGAGLDITEQRRLEMEKREAMRQVEVQRQILENRERERQEIAREIHDGPIQTLVSMMFNLQVTRDMFNQAAVRQELDQLNTSLKGAVRELRDVVNNLRPPSLLRIGLGKSLLIYAEDFREKHPDIALNIAFDLPDENIYFSEETSLSIYRICQEGLSNIVRHAQATQATIRFIEQGNNIILEIQDNGKGFEIPKDLTQKVQEGHYGLAGMKERVNALGGSIDIRSIPQSGTTVQVSIPLDDNGKVE